jgi:hypothetical protein
MNEREFILRLQKKAQEQKKLMQEVPFPKVFAFVSEWLSNHPWRYLIPLAFIISILMRASLGPDYTNFILWLFSKI